MRLLLLVGLGLVVALVSGCAPTVERARSAPIEVAPFASEEEALAAATEAYAHFAQAGDAVGQSGGQQLNRLEDVIVGPFLQQSIEGFEQFSRNGWVQVGETKFRDLSIQQFGGSSDDAVIAYLCEDISSVDVLDSLGQSVVSQDRPATSYFQVSFGLDEAMRLLVSGRVRWDERTC